MTYATNPKRGQPRLTLLEKVLGVTLVTAIVATCGFAASVTNVHGTVTIAFGRAPPAPTTIIVREKADPAQVAVAIQLPVSALGKVKP